MSWAEDEMGQVALGDQRLNRRAVRLLETMSEHPDQSIPAKSNGRAAWAAAYRFFDNEKVEVQKLLAPHREQTIARMQSQAVVLCLEDTTQLDYTTHRETTGLGPLYKEFQRGLFLHAMLAVTPAGACLGVLGAKFHARDPERPTLTPGEKAKRSIEEKESYRWLDGYQDVMGLAERCAAQLIYVADREGDIEEVLAAAQGQGAQVLIRARHDRRLADGERMWDTVWNSPEIGQQSFEIGARPGREARTVQQTLRSQTIELPETDKRTRAIRVTVVIAHEQQPPDGEDPVSWTLVTTVPVTSADDAKRLVGYYQRRWLIEEYFKVLKSGCAVEKLQLETAERLTVAVTMYMIVAYRILSIIKAGRETPDIPCDAVFEEDEWKVAYQYGTRKKPPKRPPRLLEILVIVAKLGGFTGRKSDGFPGAKTLWIGLSKIHAHLEISAELRRP